MTIAWVERTGSSQYGDLHAAAKVLWAREDVDGVFTPGS